MCADDVSSSSLLSEIACLTRVLPAQPAPNASTSQVSPGQAVFPFSAPQPARRGRPLKGAGDAWEGAAPTGPCGGSPRSLATRAWHPAPSWPPASFCTSFAYRCLFWRLLGSESPPEGNVRLWGHVTPETLNSQESLAHGCLPRAQGVGTNVTLAPWPCSGLFTRLSTVAMFQRRRDHGGELPIWGSVGRGPPVLSGKGNYKPFEFLIIHLDLFYCRSNV